MTVRDSAVNNSLLGFESRRRFLLQRKNIQGQLTEKFVELIRNRVTLATRRYKVEARALR